MSSPGREGSVGSWDGIDESPHEHDSTDKFTDNEDSRTSYLHLLDQGDMLESPNLVGDEANEGQSKGTVYMHYDCKMLLKTRDRREGNWPQNCD